MPDADDPFARHPELRDRITDPETSFFRTFSIEALINLHPHMEDILEWTHTDEVREAIRADTLAGHSGDLWIFAYGSLIWDPALRFAEVRRAHAPGHARRFILRDDNGARGTAEAPGLMAALDTGEGCEGLAYRIRERDVDTETEILFFAAR
ncbi:gamma-glutamylcyclotransferase [Roseibacterium sp. SDUM158016]|uniref:gamma-glutamylcyclotransferase n=1 Tax=Roseicyclus sediminis TaxID=2980997 RepID=UPI0021D1CC03|nr:gamma-glutamylcyclotransferase [Roseibacterium sp. SDUM158016]MCU4653078.1 gamma-glutamylcyclotransferase [Roseibacterium sp. SDUM158016]